MDDKDMMVLLLAICKLTNTPTTLETIWARLKDSQAVVGPFVKGRESVGLNPPR